MRSPFKTEDDLSNRFAASSEAIRIEYHKRHEQSYVVALSAYLEKELSRQIESQVLSIGVHVKKVNFVAILILFALAAITLTVDLPYGRVSTWFVAGSWVAYITATELFFLPILRIMQAKHWNGYQTHAREWTSLLGNSGFAEHISLVGTESRGEVHEDADKIELAIRGFALLKAEQAAKYLSTTMVN